jgi:hypothetical protein
LDLDERILNFLHFNGNDRMIGISIGVMLDNESSGFLVLPLGNLPARTLRQQEAAQTCQPWAQNLEPERESPFEISGQVNVGTIHCYSAVSDNFSGGFSLN